MTTSNEMRGKTCMVTGASTGIGKEIARGLAAKGAHVILVCRSAERGEPAVKEIVASTGSDAVELLTADLASQASIRALAEEFGRRHTRLDVLVHNAAVSQLQRTTTPDGLESVFAVNHLAPFLLTHLLLPVLKESAPARIVTVASAAHAGSLDFDNLQAEKKFSFWDSYMRSKLANLLFTYELARRLEGTGVTANALHPGTVRTELARDLRGVSRLIARLVSPLFLTPAQGADTAVYLASSPEVQGISGQYFVKRKSVRSKAISYDRKVQERLWDISARLVGLAQA